jgi:hypothetical protein
MRTGDLSALVASKPRKEVRALQVQHTYAAAQGKRQQQQHEQQQWLMMHAEPYATAHRKTVAHR